MQAPTHFEHTATQAPADPILTSRARLKGVSTDIEDLAPATPKKAAACLLLQKTASPDSSLPLDAAPAEHAAAALAEHAPSLEHAQHAEQILKSGAWSHQLGTEEDDEEDIDIDIVACGEADLPELMVDADTADTGAAGLSHITAVISNLLEAGKLMDEVEQDFVDSQQPDRCGEQLYKCHILFVCTATNLISQSQQGHTVLQASPVKC